MKIMSIANQKGGVGKTTTAFNVGAGLARQGKKVLLIDFDPQGNLSQYLGFEDDNLPTINEIMLETVSNRKIEIEPLIRTNRNENVDYIPSNISLSAAEFFLTNSMCRESILKKILQNPAFLGYDYIIIDCLPSLGILQINALTASNSVIIPVQTQKFALDGLSYFWSVFEMVKENLNPNLTIEGILATMYDNTNMSKAVIQALQEEYGDKVYRVKIDKLSEATYSTHEQKSLVNDKKSRLGEQYNEIVRLIADE